MLAPVLSNDDERPEAVLDDRLVEDEPPSMKGEGTFKRCGPKGGRFAGPSLTRSPSKRLSTKIVISIESTGSGAICCTLIPLFPRLLWQVS